MTKKRIHIDDFFRRGLGNMQMPVGSNDFAEMQAMLAAAQKRRKRRIIWLWLGGILLLTGISAGIYNFTKTSNVLAQKQPVSSTIVSPKNDTSIDPIKESSIEVTASTNDEKPSDFNIQQSDAKSLLSIKEPITSKTIPTNQIKEKQTSAGANKNELKTQSEQLVTTIDSSSKQPETSNDGRDDGAMTEAQKEPLAEQPIQALSTEILDGPVAPKQATEETKEEIEDSLPEIKDKEPKNSVTPPVKLPTSPLSIGFNFGSALTAFGLNSTSQYGNIRSNGDKAALGFNGTVMLNYSFQNLTVSSGLGYNSIAGGGQYNYTHQIYDSFPVFSQPPNSVIIGYVHTHYRDTTHNYTIQNSFNYITLPVSVSYSLPINKSKTSGIRLGLGMQIQRLVGVSGEYINPANLFKFGLGTKDNFVRKWNLNTRISMGYYYTFSKKITLDIGINYSQMAGSMLGKTSGLAVRPRSVGFEAGLRFNLLK